MPTASELCCCQLVESNAFILVLFFRGCHCILKKEKLTTQHSLLELLVILCLAECSAGLGGSSPDAAQCHFSPEDILMGTQMCDIVENYV